ncbi:sulfurtransferase TusA family protein [Calderihabitans maritimus]|uniref:UPF0033 domain-containing protein n=1 Tax=Calderihabitans maritimus TaxID=1246530 RepID=A0A1Z5HXB6_9FIRM|nr:sulfurtransferase TusA family protein [Calderihabitans maritimus]GAW94154.1 hypothetical protein GALLO_0110 [Calderihabitans maritimus]
MAVVDLDTLGLTCPFPLIKVQKKMAELSAGDVLRVETDCISATENIPNWAQKMQYPCQVKKIGSGRWEITVTKK